MSEIAKCPICGKDPEVWCRDEEIRIRIVCCKHAVYSTSGWNQYTAAMECQARHNALREAVAWERETYLFWEFGRTYTLVANDEALESMFAARAEVDRLIANEGSADCKGEG